LTGDVRCTTNAECVAACPLLLGVLPSSCRSGSCSYF
jgi:hypothetical protein